MKTLRLIFILVLIGICNYCKAQSLIVSKKYEHITQDNFVDEMVKLVERFDKEPVYFIRPLQSNCVFEILVNDILVYKEYTLEKLASPIGINHAILSSGNQNITVRLYPLGNLIKETYGEGEKVEKLLKKTQMNITVVKYSDSKRSMSLDDEEIVIKHTIPTKENNNGFVGEGLDFFQYSFSFEADVPYDIEGWNRGQDLTDLNVEELEKAVLDYYRKMQLIFNNKDEDALAKNIFGDYLIIAQTKYYRKEKIEKIWNEVKGNLYLKEKEFGALTDYRMNFYGNGKIVSLKHPSREPVDSRLRGESAFWYKYLVKNKIRAQFSSIDLYLPKGEPLESLRRIEY